MKNTLSKPSKSFLLLGATLLLLTACGKSVEDPEVVLKKAKEAIVAVNSGHVDVTATMDGGNGTDDLSFSGDVAFSFDKSDKMNGMFDLHVALSGDMQSEDKTLDGDLDVNFVTLNKEYYVKLNQLNSSDESLQTMVPFIDLYSGKWLRVAEDFIPENIRNLQGEDEIMELKRKQLEDLFVETELFTVTKEYGIEKLNGSSVYHYGIGVNIDGFKDYITKAAVIDGRELTMQEVEEAVRVLSYIESAELYIDSKDYYILKSVFHFSGEALAAEGADLSVELVVEGSDFNKTMDIKAPEGAEDFNPLNLIMGLGGLPTVELPEGAEVDESMIMEDGAMMEDVTMEEVQE